MSPEPGKYRLVTRADFDGLVCGALLRELDLIDDVLFVHPKDVQDGKIDITETDITTNLPYDPRCHLCFDHHLSEVVRRGEKAPENHVIDEDAPSAARVVFNHFGGRDTFPNVSHKMLDAVDKVDSARFNLHNILNPSGWILLSYLMDARTGLGRFKEFRVSNYQLMMDLIDYCRNHTVEEILELPDVAERKNLYFEHADDAREQIVRCATVHDHLVVLDLRDEEIIHPTNRFLIYALFPDCNISVHVLWGKNRENTVFAIGNSIIDRTSVIDIGTLALGYGGGGHANAGTCQIANEDAPRVLEELIETIHAKQSELVAAGA